MNEIGEKGKMKKTILLIAIACCITPIWASPSLFTDSLGQSAWIDVEYWTGTGDYETILVIDWNQSGAYLTESHAFGYRWDGSATTVADMLIEIDANGALNSDTGYGGAFVNNLYYLGTDADQHAHNEPGSFNLGSTGDVYAQWDNMNSNWTMLGEWEANQAGIDQEYIVDGQLEGINVMYWFDSTQPYMNLDVPFATIPEPATMSLALLGLGGLFLKRKQIAG